MVLRSSGLKQRIKSKLALHAMPQKAAAWFLLLNLMGSAEHHLMGRLCSLSVLLSGNAVDVGSSITTLSRFFLIHLDVFPDLTNMTNRETIALAAGQIFNIPQYEH